MTSVLRPLLQAVRAWQLAAVILLPAWVIVGQAIWGDTARGLLGAVLLSPIVALAAAVLAVVTNLRGSVRRARAVAWQDAVAIAAYSAGVIGAGFDGSATGWWVLLAVVGGLAAFWVAVVLLGREVRDGIRDTWTSLRTPPAQRAPIDAGEFVVLPPR